MRISELTQIIESVVSQEVRKTIIRESLGDKKEVYHVTCEGEPIDSFDTQEEAEKYIQDNKNSKKELLIDKKVYESHADMIEKLDQMGQELEEKENTNMENQEPMEGNAFVKAMLDAKEKGEKSFTVDGKEHDVEESWNQMEEEEMREEEQCEECGGPTMEDVNEGTCEECGKEICECGSGMYESKKKTLRLTESELINLITKMVNESVPGLDAAKKSRKESGEENNKYLSDLDKKMKDYLSIPGNNNNKFPEQNKEGESVKVNNTEKEDEFVADQRGRGLENLEYDNEPSEQFKKRLKMSIDGDRLMGNGSDDVANVVKTDLPKKLEKEIKRKSEDKKAEPLYKKEPQPTKAINESKVSMSSVLLEEMNKMKKLTNYNEKTQ
jgi:ribosomal protein L37AE/L43A